MGKARREAKLERRRTEQQVVEDSKFSWKKSFSRMLKVAPRVFAVMAVLLVIQIGASALNIPFVTSPVGQLIVFGVVYVAAFRWIYADVLPGRSLRK